MSDEAYDYFRYGEEESKKSILLLSPNGEIKEISKRSDLVEGITGKKLTDSKLFYPHNLIYDNPNDVRKKIIEIIEGMAGTTK